MKNMIFFLLILLGFRCTICATYFVPFIGQATPINFGPIITKASTKLRDLGCKRHAIENCYVRFIIWEQGRRKWRFITHNLTEPMYYNIEYARWIKLLANKAEIEKNLH